MCAFVGTKRFSLFTMYGKNNKEFKVYISYPTFVVTSNLVTLKKSLLTEPYVFLKSVNG